jgi:MFS family permease
LITHLGFRGVLTLGAACYCLRFLIFGSTWLPRDFIVASQVLHGFCFACSFAGAFIYIDRIAPKDARHSAQTAFTLVMLGLGPILGGVLSGELQKHFTIDGKVSYSGLWYTAAGIAGVCTIIMFWLFRTEDAESQPLSD